MIGAIWFASKILNYIILVQCTFLSKSVPIEAFLFCYVAFARR